MKKVVFNVLKSISLLVFFILLIGVCAVFKEIIYSKEGFAFNLGYGLAGVVVLGLLFWLNLKLYKYTVRATKK